jgi:superfamily II DNA or RNA helicase
VGAEGIMQSSAYVPAAGDFVEVRTRHWLVEGVSGEEALARARLACIDDDAQGETLEVLWRDEVDASFIAGGHQSVFENPGTDDPEVFSAYLRSIRWNTSTAADRKLLQAPFRAGIHLDAYQLVPLAKALALPRVNLLIADDVGAGKTIEAGLILRELILRRRIDFVVVSAPPSMTRQWQDELQAKFGLAFTIIDREYLAALRRERGFAVNPWASGSLFLLSHSLVTDEVYTAGLRDLLGEFRGRSLLILDEAHHAAPASGSRYAIDSQFTRAIRALAERFEHRLFLSATPHNGHSNSFTSLLEILDPQRFTAGVDVRPDDLAPIMVRRLKSDLKHFGENFPTRRVEAIGIDGLPSDAPELLLANKLAAYDALVAERTRNLPPAAIARSRLVMVGLQQRLLSSIAAFTRTLEKHRNRLESLADAPAVAPDASLLDPIALEDEPEDEAVAEAQIKREEDEAAEAIDVGIGDKALVDEMLEVARRHANRPDARISKLVTWIRENMTTRGEWTDRRLLLFTEYEDTRRWLERRLIEALHDLDPENRIACFTGATSTDRREELKRRFNADPATDPLRILICTDAAREGINLQARCHDLIHIDLPWNPARLEQRNGRIDRKLQLSPEVWCRYFIYRQRPEDRLLQRLVEKTETIQRQLGSAGQVLSDRIADLLARKGLRDARVTDEIDALEKDPRVAKAREEMDDREERRLQREARELDQMRKLLEDSRKRVGVESTDLRAVVAAALGRAGASLNAARVGEVGGTELFRFDPAAAVFGHGGWQEALDDLRIRRRGRKERLKAWRADAPLKAIAFEPARDPKTGVDVQDVVQVHLEHRLVRRLLSRFLSQGFTSGLSRVCSIIGPGAQPRVVLIGRLALYGAGAARLHEEVLMVTAAWTEPDRRNSALRAFGERGEEATLDQLEQALRENRTPSPAIVERLRSSAIRDAGDLEPELKRRAEARRAEVARELVAIGEQEADALRKLLADQRARIAKREATFDDRQLSLDLDPVEAEQARRDRRRWQSKHERLAREIITEPKRVQRGYDVVADRLEIVGLVHLWPKSN